MPEIAVPSDTAMTLERLEEFIVAIDADAQLRGAASKFTVEDIPVAVIAPCIYNHLSRERNFGPVIRVPGC